MSSKNLRDLIRQLNRVDVEKASFEYILSIIHKAIIEARIHITLTRSTELYFRARICNETKVKKINELKAPPAEFVKGFQRCNRPGVPMFYGASKRITALLECNVKEGDKVYLGQWINREPLPVNTVLSTVQDYQSNFELTDKERILYTYIDTIFTRPVHETFSNAYKITTAVAEVLTTNYAPEKDFDIRKDSTVGIIYPSVTNIADSYNTAFHAKFAEERLELIHVMELLVTKRDGKKVVVEVLDNAIEFPDGEIAWLSESAAIPKLIHDPHKLTFIWNGRAWVIATRDVIATDIEINELINENTNGKLEAFDNA
jgi:hypothetical protein